MKLKMLLNFTFNNSTFYDHETNNPHCVLRWEPPIKGGARRGFYIGNKKNHGYNHLNACLKKLL
jgi:hypothetical protein